MSVRILTGDVREQLRTLADESVDCVVTSPPYWGLRDYGIVGQLGLEPTYSEHVLAMVDVFRDVRRVLKSSGTLWLNYGDSYATSVNGRSAADTKSVGNDDRTFRDKPFSTIQGVLKPKDLCGIPWRVAFALQEDGWWLRQDIIWSKPNPMPESVTDRCTKAHEYLFLLAKNDRYYYDADAIAEASIRAGDIPQGSHKHTASEVNDARIRQGLERHSLTPVGDTRNRRSVWEVATAPFSEAHFATFPPDLIDPCIKAGSSERGVCRECGAPWVRVTESGPPVGRRDKGGCDGFVDHGMSQGRAGSRASTTLRWEPSCKCRLPNTVDAVPYSPVPATILDPFGGAGTTGLVADRLGRNAILIELNPQYVEIARKRIKGDCPMFCEVA